MIFIKQNSDLSGFVDFERKSIKEISIVGIFISIVAAIFNILDGLGFNIIMLSLVAAVSFTVSYYWAKFYKSVFWLKSIFTAVVLIFTNLIWLYNCGSNGPAPYFYAIILSLFVFIWQGKQLIFISFIILVNIILIFHLDLTYPLLTDKIFHYKNNTTRIYDVYTTTLMYSVIIFVVVNQAKKTLQNEYRKAKHSDTLKSAFLANMSHEIRTPMNSIIGFTQLLKDTSITEDEKKHFIDIIRYQGEYLLALINNIIDISKIESGVITINEKPINIIELMEDIRNSSLNFKRMNIDLKISIDEKIENNRILTDSTKLKQVLSNLVSNSLKFTLRGYVELGFRILNNNYIEFYVKDTGIGIPKHELDKIFERFYQMEIKNSEVINSGTGLGLSISKALIEYLDGKIRVESEENIGSVFYVTIPYKPVKTNKTSSSLNVTDNNNDFKKQSILIVEDVESNYYFLNQALSEMKIHTIWSKNGQEAVNYVENNKLPDLILMDIKMPVMDGYEATKLIKHKYPNIPIIAQTAYAFEHEHVKALEAGCNNYITKPIDIRILKEIIHKYLEC